MRLTKETLKRLGVSADPLTVEEKIQRRKAKHEKDRYQHKLFDAACKAHGLPIPIHEYRFHKTRRWRFDYLFEGLVGVEKVGGVWIHGHHSRGQSQINENFQRFLET